MARDFLHLSLHGNSGFSQSFLKMAYEIAKPCMRRDGITGNTRTITIVFQFAKIEHYSTAFQRHTRLKNLCEN